MVSLHNIQTLFEREIRSFFLTPLAYIFIIIFLVLSGAMTFFLGDFFARGQADLQPFFAFHPWLFLILMPALSMKLWAEERRTGTIELLLTYPIKLIEAVLGKFLAAWAFAALALALTFPVWITVNYLGDPDNGVILASYIGSWLMAGAFLAIGSVISAATKNQVIAFILSATLCFLLTVSGSSIVLNFFTGWAPAWMVDMVSNLGFLPHFDMISQGVLGLKNLLYFLSLIILCLFATIVVIDVKKAA